MGLFDWMTGSPPETKTQLMFFDNQSFKFRKMPMEDMCLVEKKDGEVFKAWVDFFGAEYEFLGYKGIKADKVTLSFNRDFILDCFNRVKEADKPESGKPKRGDSNIKLWTKEIAEGQRYKVMNKPGSMLLINKITMFLGIGLILELIMMGLSKAWG